MEIWHPQTHTFIFPTFKASVLLEETKLLLGLRRAKVENNIAAHSMGVL